MTKGAIMKKAFTVILTIICGFLANIIAAVPAVSVLLTEESIVFGLLCSLLIAYGFGALLNLIGKKLEEKRIIARRALLLIAQLPFVVIMAFLFITNAVNLYNYEPSLGDMWTGMHYWSLSVGYYMYLGGLATSAAATACAIIVMLVDRHKART